MTKPEALNIIKGLKNYAPTFDAKRLLDMAIETFEVNSTDDLKIELTIPNKHCRNCSCGEITYLNGYSLCEEFQEKIYAFSCDNKHICKYLEAESEDEK